jgi:hypothetical protein
MKALRILLWLVLVVFLPAHALAQCPPKTTISDTLYNADGSPAAGRVVIAWPTFQIGACQVIAGQATVNVTNGAFNVQLYPNDAAVPSGTSYRAAYYLKSGRLTTEYWVVPTSASPVALVAVRSSSVPVPNVMFSQAQVTNLVPDLARKVELPSPCAAGKFLQSNGTATPPQVNCVDGTGGGGSGSQHQVNGTNLAANDPVNFQDTPTIAITNPSAGNIQAGVKDGSITAGKLSVAGPTGAQLGGIGDANIPSGALSPNRISGTAEVQTNKGAANGYASLNASQKVVQDPANAQAAPAASKIPMAGGGGTLDDAWLSATVTRLGTTIELDSGEVANTLPPSKGGTGANNAATTGRYLRGDGANFATSSVAAAGAGSCTNQFIRAANDNAAPTCATVAKADAVATFVHTDQANTWTAGAQDFGAATSLVVPKAGGAAPTADGDVRYDTTQDAWAAGGAGAITGYFPRVLIATNCTTEGNCTTTNEVNANSGEQGTTETNFASSISIPANFLVAKKSLRVSAVFEATTSGSAPNITLRLKAGSTVLWQSGTAGPGNNLSNAGSGMTWVIQGTAAPGASVSVETGGVGNICSAATNPNCGRNTVAQPVSVATNASFTLQLSAQWSAATNGNNVKLRAFLVEEIF